MRAGRPVVRLVPFLPQQRPTEEDKITVRLCRESKDTEKRLITKILSVMLINDSFLITVFSRLHNNIGFVNNCPIMAMVFLSIVP